VINTVYIAYITYLSFLREADKTEDEHNHGNDQHHGKEGVHHVLHPIRPQVHVSPITNRQHDLQTGAHMYMHERSAAFSILVFIRACSAEQCLKANIRVPTEPPLIPLHE